MNRIIEYFDLASQYRPGGSHAVSGGKSKKLHWFPQYIALLLGIVFQPLFQQYMSTGIWEFSEFGGHLLASAIIGVMAFPSVYKGSFDATKPIFVQLCVIFIAGTGWQTLVGSALKAANILPS